MCDQQNLNELFNDSILPQFRSWINFLTEISPHEVSWDEHRSDAESVKILYNYSIELSKYADRINGCSGILKFGVNPDEGKLVLKQAFFLPCSSLPCVSVAQISTLEGGYVSAIAKYSGTLSYPSLGISNPHREKPTCYRIAWHLEAHEWFMEAIDWNQAV